MSAPRPAPRVASREQLMSLLGEPAAAAGLDLEDVEIRLAGRRRLIRVVVDRDGGVSLDAVAEVSRRMSDLLDESDTLDDMSFVLEVSSPGVDRPLTEPRHWRRAVRRLVSVTTNDGETFEARVTATDDAQVTLDIVTKQSTSERVMAYADVARAQVQVEFRELDEEN